jgi:hypothetical protein
MTSLRVTVTAGLGALTIASCRLRIVRGHCELERPQ